MKREIVFVLLFIAVALAANACDRDDSTVGSQDEPARQASRSAGSGVSGSEGKAGEAAQPDPAERVKESVFDQKQTEKRLEDQTRQAQKGGQGQAADSAKPEMPGAGGAQAEKGASTGTGGREQGVGERAPKAGPVESRDPSKVGEGPAGASQSEARLSQRDIRQAQRALKEQGQDPGPIDGIMGPQTRRALREFQQKQGLEQTGTLDAATRQRLNIGGSAGSARKAGEKGAEKSKR